MGLSFKEIIGSTPANDSFNDESIEATFTEDPTSSQDATGNTFCESGSHWYEREKTRGRAPKNCPEHQVRTSTSRGTAAKGTKALRELEEDLAATLSKGGIGLATAGLRVTGVIMTDRSARTAAAMVTLAKEHPKALKALSTASKAAPALEIGETVGMLMVGAQLDKGMIEPDHMLPALTGTTKYWEMVNGSVEAYKYQRAQEAMRRTTIDEDTRFVPIG